MRIGLFTDGYEPQTSGLIVSIKMLKTELTKLGHEVFVITLSDKDQDLDQDNVLRFKGRTVPFKALKEYRLRGLKGKDIKKVQQLNLDVLHVHTEFSMGKLGLAVAKKSKLPIVYTSHTMFFDYTHFVPFFLRPIATLMLRSTFRKFHYNTQKTIYPTKKVLLAYKDLIKKHFNYEIIPSGIDLSNFTDKWSKEECLNLRHELGIKDEEKVCLFLGRLSQEKSVDVIIDSFKGVKDGIKLVVAGDGAAKEELEKQVHNLGLDNKVIFTGMIPWDRVGLYYSMADLFLNASLTETQGLTYVEALASRLPVVCRYDLNLEDVIVDGFNGKFFKENEELTNIVNTIFEGDINSLKNNALEKALTYSSANYAKNIERVYKDVKQRVL